MFKTQGKSLQWPKARSIRASFPLLSSKQLHVTCSPLHAIRAAPVFDVHVQTAGVVCEGGRVGGLR